jgi:uncharacterized protein (DUF952 family)
MIYHIVISKNWQDALKNGFYEAASLQSEGFIHCSLFGQVNGVLERYYKNQEDLLLLHIEESKLVAPLTYELAPSIQEYFPHVYGRINLDAVVDTIEIDSKMQ